MGHVDVLKLFLLASTLVAWALLVVVMVGPPGLRVGGHLGSALAFLLAAGITRLTFTEVETRIQITAFCTAAALLVARQTAGAAGGDRLARWAACAAGTVVGAVVVRELVHHVLERLM